MSSFAQPIASKRILLAESVGFCFGVRRAVELAQQVRARRSGRMTMLGPLVHNQQVSDRLSHEGIESATNVDAIDGGTVLLSAHGVSPKIVEQVRERGLQMVDLTCPFVTKVHNSAKKLHDQGYEIVLLGDKDHTEVRGVVGFAESIGAQVKVIAYVCEIASLSLGNKVGVISQTTQRAESFGAVVAELSKRCAEVRAFNTICNATDELQDAARKLARQASLVIVVGGVQSANTRRLAEICREEGAVAHQIETASDIEDHWLEGHDTIGLTAGASTPDWVIEQVAARVNGGSLPPDWNLQHPD